MAKTRKTWQEKLADSKGLPKVVDVPEKWTRTYGTGKMLIATPLLVDALMRKVEKGKLLTVREIRRRLTDVIIPVRYLNVSEPAELARHCMEDIDAEFVAKSAGGLIEYTKKRLASSRI